MPEVWAPYGYGRVRVRSLHSRPIVSEIERCRCKGVFGGPSLDCGTQEARRRHFNPSKSSSLSADFLGRCFMKGTANAWGLYLARGSEARSFSGFVQQMSGSPEPEASYC